MIPMFSIVLPVYNVAPYLRRCLDSLLAQSYASFEVICVDDGSTDGSGGILDDYARRDGRVRVCHQPNAGVSAARNKGLLLALGRWVAFADGDDYVDADWLLNFKLCFEKTGVEVVYSGCVSFDSRENPVRRGAAGDYDAKSLEDVSAWIWGHYAEFGYVVAYAYEARVLRGHQFVRGVAMSEDSLFGFALAETIDRAVCSTYAGYFYYQRSDSAVRIKLSSEERLRFLEAVRNVLTQDCKLEVKRQAVIHLVWRNFIGWVIRPADQVNLPQIAAIMREFWSNRWLRLNDLKWHWRFPFLVFVWFRWIKPLRMIGLWLSRRLWCIGSRIPCSNG